MKKFLSILILMLFSATILPTQAITYEQAMNQSKMIAMLVYAPWVDNLNETISNVKEIEAKNKNKFNFVYLNIATEDAKKYCTENYIYPGMPYLVLMKKKGKIVRILRDDCISSGACMQNKIDHFGD